MKSKIKTYDLIMCALFTALVAVGAFIKIPVPAIPVTLQLFFTTVAGLLLGGKLGALSVLLYVALGLLGIPVFASGGGLGYVFVPTFGYLIGFIFGAFVTGTIANKTCAPSFLRLLAANFSGLIVVYLVGLVYYYIICNFVINTPIGLWPLFLYGFAMVVPGDAVLSVLAAVVAKRLIPFLHKLRSK